MKAGNLIETTAVDRSVHHREFAVVCLQSNAGTVIDFLLRNDCDQIMVTRSNGYHWNASNSDPWQCDFGKVLVTRDGAVITMDFDDFQREYEKWPAPTPENPQ